MPVIGTVRAGRKPVTLHAFTGHVVDQARSTHTETYRGSNNAVSSRTTHANEIFVRADDGEERALTLYDAGFSVRAGSLVSFVWGIPQGKERGDYVPAVNHDTGAIHHIRKPINDLAGPPLYNMLLIVAVIVGCVGLFDLFSGDIGSAVVLMGLGAGGVYWIYRGQKHLMAEITAAVLNMRPQPAGAPMP